jgi:glycosyltransferase involved in cell wall biosynthesis
MGIDVSVIIPTFRRPAVLAEAIDSALRQTGVDLEVIVRDSSDDRSAEAVVAAAADPRVRYAAHASPIPGRPAVIRNAAFAEARGRYVHFLDDDDRVLPGAYRTLAGALDVRPKTGVVFGRIAAFGDDARAVDYESRLFSRGRRRALRSLGMRQLLVAQLLFSETFLVTSSCMVRADCVRALGGFANSIAIFEDVDFFARAIWRFGGAFIDQPVLERRVWPSLVRVPGSGQATREAYGTMQAAFRSSEGPARYAVLKAASVAMRFLG